MSRFVIRVKPAVSIRMLNYVFEHSNATGSARLVLLALADRANDAGTCWPSVDDTARRARLSRRQAERAIRNLVDGGELVIVRAGGGAGRTNRYVLRAGRSDDELRPLSSGKNPVGGDGVSAVELDTNPVRSGAKPRQIGHETPSAVTGEPTEPSVNRQTESPVQNPGAMAVTVAADPEATEFERALVERRADHARRNGARSAKPLPARLLRGLAKPGPPASVAARRRRKIPKAEQRQTYTLLRAVPGLAEADARDLARIGTVAEFQGALGLLSGQAVRNPGGFLRQAVTEGWT